MKTNKSDYAGASDFCDVTDLVEEYTYDADGNVLQDNHYYPYGMLMAESSDILAANVRSIPSLNSTTPAIGSFYPYLFGGKEYIPFKGSNHLDFSARIYDNTTITFGTPDPMRGDYTDIHAHLYCAGNPVMFIDPTGCDTIRVDYADNKWTISEPIISEGPDVFILSNGLSSQIYEFNEGEYGKRVIALNLENNGEGSYNLGVYHVSGESDNATGFFVTPGGAPSNKNNSGKRIKDGIYPIIAPADGVKWRTPGVGGEVKERGIRFHYSDGTNPLAWTQGCFVLFSTYTTDRKSITITPQDSRNASINFNKALGASEIFTYKFKNNKGVYKTRTGARFPHPINYNLILKSR